MLTNKGSVVLCSKHRARSRQVCTVLLALLDLTGGLGTPLAELLSMIQGRETSGCRGERAGGRAKHCEGCTCRGWEVTNLSQRPPASAREPATRSPIPGGAGGCGWALGSLTWWRQTAHGKAWKDSSNLSRSVICSVFFPHDISVFCTQGWRRRGDGRLSTRQQWVTQVPAGPCLCPTTAHCLCPGSSCRTLRAVLQVAPC